MATLDSSKHAEDGDQEPFESWLRILGELVATIRAWAIELGWSVKDVPKAMQDSAIGRYNAPGLIIQKNFTKVLLEPITRSAPGVDGVVDLYLMPGLDDIASLYFYDGQWHVHHTPAALTSMHEPESKLLNKETLQFVLDEMCQNAV